LQNLGDGLVPKWWTLVESLREGEGRMNRSNLARLPTDELWKVYESVTEALAARIIAEKQALDSKLALLKHQSLIRAQGAGAKPAEHLREKRKYPKVLQKYRNPDDHSQTWSGRGKRPLWVAKLLKSGTKLDDLVIPQYRKMTRRAA
jgi:DNA-binding protein H-NS